MTGAASTLDGTAAAVVDEVLAAPPSLGATGRLVCVDGPAGSGKTTLAAALEGAARARGRSVEVLHMDDVYRGWTGLDAGREVVARDVVAPLAQDRPGRYRRYDWHRGELAEEHVVGPCDLLVVEGVGARNPVYDDATGALVWVEAPPGVRLQRGLARDGEAARPHWLAWREAEEELFAREHTRDRADVLVDGLTGGSADRP